ncbi:MAG: cell wall-binding repeat-containing protein [Bacillota bacterium]
MTIITKLVAAGVILSTAAAPNVLSVEAAGTKGMTEVQLLSVNDLHGKIDQEYEIDVDGDGTTEKVGGMDYVAAYFKEREAQNPNTLIVHTGDMIGGSPPVAALLQDEPVIEMMNAMGFDVGTAGNHEFDEGVTELMRILNGGDHPNGTAGYKGQDFPMVAANVEYKDSGDLLLDPYHIEEVDGKKIGFIGVVTTQTPDMVMPAGIDSIKFTDEAAAVNKYTAELKDQGVKAIVVLAHVPGGQDESLESTGAIKALAESVDDEVDVIYAGHDHKKTNDVVDNKLIVQASDYGKAFADVDLTLDETGQVVSKTAEIVDVVQDGMTPDPAVNAILTKYQEEVAPIINEVIGEAAIALDGGYGVKGPVGDNALGNLIADGMKAAMDADFALMNGGGIRDDLNAGDITWGELYNIQPFSNILTKVDIKGADLFGIMNDQLSAEYGPDYSIGGFNYTWEPVNGVVDIFLPNGDKIDPEGSYSVVVNNYMWTSTSEKYTTLQAQGENEEIGPIDVDATVDFVRSFNEPITYIAEGRISQVETPATELGEVTIAEARAAEDTAIVTVEGVVTTTPGSWGGNGFYIQDATGGVYIAASEQTGAKIGDHVKLTGMTADKNGEFQLAEVKNFEVIGSGEIKKQIVQPSHIGEDNEGEVVLLKNAEISDLTEVNSYGTFEFKANKGGKAITVRFDNRAGMKFSDFDFANGDRVDVAGVVSEYNGTYQVKPRMAEDIVDFKVELPKRVAGETRYETAASISAEGWDKSDTVIIARGDSYPDALAGAPLSYQMDAPILLTDNKKLDESTLAEIERLEAKHVIVIGGENAISPKVVKELKAQGLEVERIDGEDRFETAVNIAEKMDTTNEKAILVYGRGYADSLTIASYAAQNGYPVFLTDTKKLTSETKAELDKYSEVLVIGGETVISKDVEAELSVKTTRIGGENRFETSQQIIDKLNIMPEAVMVTTAYDFADGLTGSVLAAKWNGTILLTHPNELTSETSAILDTESITKTMVLGGTNAVSDKVKTEIEKKFK